MLPPLDITRAIETTVREEWGRCLAVLAKTTGSLQLAEDCLQDALISAMDHWQRNGLPKVPRAWLLTTARRKAIDRLRRDQSFASKQDELAYLIEQDAMQQHDNAETQSAIPDERLALIFSCCHPDVEEKSRVALTLRALGGLSVDSIASAFLDTPDAMARRLTRAKQKISDLGLSYRVPEKVELPARRASVLRTLYLIFNEGYAASSGEGLMRKDLCAEAIRLARITAYLMPESVEAAGLLALMLLHDSRKAARVDDNSNMISLEDQNRARWNRSQIEEGVRILQSVLPIGRPGPFQIQAAISAVHATAPTWDDTDWPQIAQLYGLLVQLEPSPVIKINMAVAQAHAGDIEAALKLLESLKDLPKMDRYASYHAACADAYRRLGQFARARQSLDRAIELTGNASELAFLKRKLAQLAN